MPVPIESSANFRGAREDPERNGTAPCTRPYTAPSARAPRPVYLVGQIQMPRSEVLLAAVVGHRRTLSHVHVHHRRRWPTAPLAREGRR